MIRLQVEYSDRPGAVDVWPEEFGNRDEAIAYLRELALVSPSSRLTAMGPGVFTLARQDGRGGATFTLLDDDGATTPTILAIAALLAVAVLAVWTLAAPAAAVDGRGVLAAAIAAAAALTVRARGRRGAVR